MAPKSPSMVDVKIDETSYIQVMTYLKNVNDVGYKALQKTARKIAFDIKAAQQEAVRNLDTKGARGGGRKLRALAVYAASSDTSSRKTANAARRVTSLRQAAARAVAVETRTTPGRNRTSSMRVRLRASKMAPGQGRLPKHMNYGTWRHPVFADNKQTKVGFIGTLLGRKSTRDRSSWTWVDQTVSPKGWFDGTFAARKDKATRDLVAATKEAYEKYRVK